MPKRGKRVQIYLPVDLVERWEQTPRYERSAVVATALRKHWEIVKTEKIALKIARADDLSNEKDAAPVKDTAS